MYARVAGGRATCTGGRGNCALYAVGTAGDELRAQVVQIVSEVLLEVLLCEP